ncbi:hypothetical protein [Flaviaesturariibacter terrae]
MNNYTRTAGMGRMPSFLGGAPLLTVLPELLLLALVLYLFTFLFRNCIGNKRGEEATGRLLDFLGSLQHKFTRHLPIDPAAERAALESLLNKVKTENTSACISGDAPLRFHFVRSYNLVSEWLVARATESDKVQWMLLDSLMQDFYEVYLARKAPPVKPATPVFRLQHLPRRAV